MAKLWERVSVKKKTVVALSLLGKLSHVDVVLFFFGGRHGKEISFSLSLSLLRTSTIFWKVNEIESNEDWRVVVEVEVVVVDRLKQMGL